MRVKKSHEIAQAQEIPSDRFSSWLRRTRQAQKTNEEASVPCGACTACCTSSYFIHIRPDETDTLAKIPKELLFAAPGLPKGHVVLGYDKNGHCPMFIGNKCSIYENRPQTCRQYDCRIFSATGLSTGSEKPLITQQAGRWRFDFPTPQDHEHFRALQAAAKFLREHADSFPPGFVPDNPTQQAVVAIKVYEVFLHTTHEDKNGEHAARNHELVKAVLAAYERFEAKESKTQ
ncbi:MAG TPA: YkgJ family cysteine cluster protein [Methylomirabilota bacterium]|jgi:Fe-S-cluster containining protein|nr:YkgJ family cysteine cluster protein [Methylomirabilota bacterium]